MYVRTVYHLQDFNLVLVLGVAFNLMQSSVDSDVVLSVAVLC
jgi:hypothetical protein